MSFGLFWFAGSMLTALPLLAAGPDGAETVPPAVAAAIADARRPAEQTQLDQQRKPAQMMVFAGVKAGDRVADFMSGNAYFTRILSKVVGPSGKVYAFLPDEELRNCPPAEVAGSRAVAHDPTYDNVTLMRGPVNEISTPQPVDVLWTAQNYHDLHDAFMGPADIGKVNRAFFKSVKPGGVFIVIDHAAAEGSGWTATETLHRIDPVSLRKEIEAAGFVFEAQDEDLRNATDDHSRPVFDPLVRGRTDQFVYRFRKPKSGPRTPD
jgi:predicted methyltransferase